VGEAGLLERVLQIPKLVAWSADSRTPEIAPLASRGPRNHPDSRGQEQEGLRLYACLCV